MKKINPTTARSRPKSRSKVVKLAHAKRPVLRHLKLVEHKHTGKLVKTRHSSYVALVGILVVVGFFLFITQGIAKADGSSVSISAVVKGAGPTVGAKITSPIDGFNIINLNPTQVEGTCVADSFVVVYNDSKLSGSTICTSAGVFDVNVQLHEGANVLSARNFDDLNQAGPDTPAVTVTFTAETVAQDVAQPNLPETPVIIPGVTPGLSDCANYTPTGTLTTGGQPHVAVVCVPQTVQVNEDHNIGVLVWGGVPPYALNFKWGSGDETLISMDAPGYKAVKVHYASSGTYNINVQVTDRGSTAATGQSAVQVTNSATQPQDIAQIINNITGASWFETPVPLYVIAVGLTLGFWGGDIFSRRFGAKHLRKKTRRAS
ncbi:hypothetical protein EPN95_00695 [Patescibacteria group bacterium]|nr:MAG: hypothetical protein EPN95_00695 [Patescibacteria group bacterium]